MNKIGNNNDQPAGIQIPDTEGNLTILDFLTFIRKLNVKILKTQAQIGNFCLNFPIIFSFKKMGK